MNERRIIDLFAGLGGFSLAANWNGIEPAVQVEINPFFRAGLKRAWPNAAHHADIRTFDARPYRGIWAVMGGPPCQPASRAGQQRGASDDRWLWGEAIRVVKEAESTWFLFENPPGILDVGLDGIIADLEGLGYEVQPLSIPACAVDSPQDRERIWILGHSESLQCEGQRGDSSRRRDGKEQHPQPVNEEPDISEATGGPGREQPGRCSSEPTQDEPVANGDQERQGRLDESNRQAGEGWPADCVSAKNEPVANPELPERRPDTERRGRAEQGEHRQGQATGGLAEHAAGDEADSQTLNRRAFRYDRPSWPWRAVNGDSAWSDFEWLPCPDPKHGTVLRRAPIGLYDVADGLQLDLPKGVCGKMLEALGNSIVSQVAAEIIHAMIQSETE